MRGGGASIVDPMTDQALTAVSPAPIRARRAPMSLAWLGVVPFFLFAVMFLILPTLDLVLGAFRTPQAISPSTISCG